MENGGKAAQPPALFVMTGRRPGHLLQFRRDHRVEPGDDDMGVSPVLRLKVPGGNARVKSAHNDLEYVMAGRRPGHLFAVGGDHRVNPGDDNFGTQAEAGAILAVFSRSE
jgi:hypothetical protein